MPSDNPNNCLGHPRSTPVYSAWFLSLARNLQPPHEATKYLMTSGFPITPNRRASTKTRTSYLRVEPPFVPPTSPPQTEDGLQALPGFFPSNLCPTPSDPLPPFYCALENPRRTRLNCSYHHVPPPSFREMLYQGQDGPSTLSFYQLVARVPNPSTPVPSLNSIRDFTNPFTPPCSFTRRSRHIDRPRKSIPTMMRTPGRRTLALMRPSSPGPALHPHSGWFPFTPSPTPHLLPFNTSVSGPHYASFPYRFTSSPTKTNHALPT